MKTIVGQLFKEFRWPFLVAVLWTIFNVYSETADKRTIRLAVNIFGAAFFLASWAMSQWYRVRKQQSVDLGLSDIQSRLANLITQLEIKTAETTAFITGGDSVCYLTGNMGTQHHPHQVDPVWIVHHGRYPLYDIQIRIVDIDLSTALVETPMWLERRNEYETLTKLGSLIPGHAADINVALPIHPDSTVRNFNIFFSARNGSFTQLLRFRKIDGQWLRATKVVMAKTMYEDVPEGYPRDANGQVNWDTLQ